MAAAPGEVDEAFRPKVGAAIMAACFGEAIEEVLYIEGKESFLP